MSDNFDPKLLDAVRGLIKPSEVTQLNSILEAAYATRNANDLVITIPAEFSVTGKTLALVVGRSYLLNETPYVAHEWNMWPDVIPPRLDTEPYIEGHPQECDYWLVRLKGGRYVTAKFTSQKNWVQVQENAIDAFREFSPRPALNWLNTQSQIQDSEWNAFPKFTPVPDTYEVLLSDGRRRAVSWTGNEWTFYENEIVAFKKII